MSRTFHVYPSAEEALHVTVGLTCSCGPRQEDEAVIVHRRFRASEFYFGYDPLADGPGPTSLQRFGRSH